MKGALLAFGLLVGCAPSLDEWETMVVRGSCSVGSPLVEDPDIGSASAPIINGQPTSDFTGVGYLLTQGSEGRRVCTGTLVSPTRVVTAAHCFFDDSGAPVTEATFGFGTTVGGETIAVARWLTHPNYRAGEGGFDLAYFDVPPQPYETAPLHFEMPCQMQRMLLVGFGVSDPSDSGTAGTKRTFVSQIDRVQALTLHSYQSAGGSCIGDSGGPVLLFDMAAGSYVLAGTTARGSRDCRGEAIYARVDVARDFLTQGGYTSPLPPMCTNACGAPNGLCEDGGAGAVAATCAFGSDCADCGAR